MSPKTEPKVGSPEHVASVGWHPSVSWEERRDGVRQALFSPLVSPETKARLEAELAELDKGEDKVGPEGRK